MRAKTNIASITVQVIDCPFIIHLGLGNDEALAATFSFFVVEDPGSNPCSIFHPINVSIIVSSIHKVLLYSK